VICKNEKNKKKKKKEEAISLYLIYEELMSIVEKMKRSVKEANS
jgi:hypothetical protein